MALLAFVFAPSFYDASILPVGIEMCGVWLSESPRLRWCGWMQPLTTNESTQTHSLICHTCNERIPAMLPYTAVNVHINTHTRAHTHPHTRKHQWTFTPTHKQQWIEGRCGKNGIHLIPMPLRHYTQKQHETCPQQRAEICSLYSDFLQHTQKKC